MNIIPIPEFSQINSQDFDKLALDVFQYQRNHCKVYANYCQHLGIGNGDVARLSDIPFLPIELFKTHRIMDCEAEPELIFESSGTTGQHHARHYVLNSKLYGQSFLHSFQKFYGSPKDYCILALLPSYLERKQSSLVYMIDQLMKMSKNADNGFFLHDFDRLRDSLAKNELKSQQTLFIGVSYALLDFSELHPMPLRHTIVMETGGMKGKRPEIPRNELHRILKKNFELDRIHSEYGMTELLSQAYSRGEGVFHSPEHLRVMIRNEDDPLTCFDSGDLIETKTGPINIIDLANIHSCSFIATQDVGRLYPDGSFEVIGRMQDSSARGCGLMYDL